MQSRSCLPATLATLVLPLSILGYLALMSLLAYYHAPGPAQWVAGVGGGLVLAWLVLWDRIRERVSIARAARAVRLPQGPPLQPADQSGD